MFAQAWSQIRNSVYGVAGTWARGEIPVSFTNGTAFMISPGILVTAAHLVHVNADLQQPLMSSFEVIRAPDIGSSLEPAEWVAEDSVRDLALLRVQDPRSEDSVRLAPDRVALGSSCGSVAFPLARVRFTGNDKVFHLVERFQGMYISAFPTQIDAYGREISYYETDALMYKGSSGCPGFLTDGLVFGMHTRSIMGDTEEATPAGVPVRVETRLTISAWVPSMEIISFALDNGVPL